MLVLIIVNDDPITGSLKQVNNMSTPNVDNERVINLT